MQKSRLVTVLYVILLSAGILAVLGVVFLPRLSAKKEMRRRVAAVVSETAQYTAFVDPLYSDPQTPFGGGRTVSVAGEDLAAVREALSALSADASFRGSEREQTSALDRHLLVKTDEGEFVQIFFTDEGFYYLKKGKIYRFAPKDPAAFAALLDLLQTLA